MVSALKALPYCFKNFLNSKNSVTLRSTVEALTIRILFDKIENFFVNREVQEKKLK